MTPAVWLLFLFFLGLPVVASGANARKDLQGIQKEIKKKEFLLKTTEKIEQQVSGDLPST